VSFLGADESIRAHMKVICDKLDAKLVAFTKEHKALIEEPKNGVLISDRMTVLENSFRLITERVKKLEEDSLGLADKLDVAISDVKPLPGRIDSLNDAFKRLETDTKNRL